MLSWYKTKAVYTFLGRWLSTKSITAWLQNKYFLSIVLLFYRRVTGRIILSLHITNSLQFD